MSLLNEFEIVINYKFNNKDLLKQALIHTSYANEKKMNHLLSNERLEFLGDAVLELTVSDFLYTKNKDMPEGKLTKTRASVVCEKSLSFLARQISLGKYIKLGKGEELSGGRDRDSIISDAFEAVIGAIYLDGGIKHAKEFVDTFVIKDIDKMSVFHDSKTLLQEYIQGKYEENLEYRVVNEEGPGHNKTYTVEVLLGEEVIGKGIGKNKKSAEQSAAYEALRKRGKLS